MDLSTAGPYLATAIVAILTAWLTHRRATKAHSDAIVIDRQKLINDTYEAVLRQLRVELDRKEDAHRNERISWAEIERSLRETIINLSDEVSRLTEEVTKLKAREGVVEETTRNHVEDSTRHTDRRAFERPADDDPREDLPT